MSQLHFRLLLIGSLALFAVACSSEDGTDEAVLDDENASFGIGKADGDQAGFTACQLREVLALVNESSTTSELLTDEIKVHSRASKSLIEHRYGPDGINGTADDDLFDDLAELDAVKYVGPAALDAFASFAKVRCEVTLDRPFIHDGTFDRATGGGWGRNAPEFEAAMTIHGATPRALSEVVNGTDDKDRPMFNRLRRNKIMEAFTYGYAIDEMPWDGDSFDAREDLPFLALSIENGRFVPDEDDDRERELSLGTDYFDDIYYDTDKYDLLEEGLVLRGRVRWDTDTDIRRLLVQAKSATSIDENGIKQSSKVDVRTDSPDAHVGTLNDDVLSGTVAWTGQRVPLEPVKTVYDQLVDSNRLEDIGNYEKVLLLEPKAYLRSKRSRFHFNFTDDATLERFYRNGHERIQHAIDFAQTQLDAGIVPADAVADVEALIAMGTGILSGELILDRAKNDLGALDPAVETIEIYPQDFGGVRVSSQHDLDLHRIVAESADDLMDEFADLLDDVDRDLTDSSRVEALEDYVDLYVEFQKSLDPSVKTFQTYKPFLERYENFVAQGDAAIDTQIETFNLYRDDQIAAGNGDFEDVEPMNREAFDALGPLLRFETLKVSQRMIGNGGTVGRSLWFEMARKYYVPAASDSSWSNFLIDTFDVTYYLTEPEWNRIPEGERTPAFELPTGSIYHTTVVNEVQIELTMIEPYADRISELKAEIASSGSTPELEAQLAGAQFVLDESISTLQVISELKGDGIIDELEDAGLDDLEWAPSAYSKGETALRILTDTD